MRLICPNCDAQYEVDDGAIPEAGRDVQCSNCGHAWFQMREAEADDLTAELYDEPAAAETVPVPAAIAQTEEPDEPAEPPAPPPGAPPVQRTLDESVLAVLREEAEREAAARKAEAAGLELQGDLGLPPPVPASVGAAAAARTISASEQRIAAMKGEPAAALRPAARRDLLPDIEEINSSLRPNEVAASLSEAAGKVADVQASSGFRSGFVLVLIVAAVVVALYVMAPQISAQIPGAADAMSAYVATIDAARQAVDGLMRQATGMLNNLTGG